MKHSNVNKNHRILERADFTSNLYKRTFLKRFFLRELNIFVKINLFLLLLPPNVICVNPLYDFARFLGKKANSK